MRRLFPLIILASIGLNFVYISTVVSSWNSPLTSYSLLSPRIFNQHKNDIIINFTDLRAQLRSFVAAQKNMQIGMYFEYLPSGVSIGVNDSQKFISASLIKVPFVMGVSKLIETGQLNTDRVITLQKEDLDAGFGTLWKRGAGTTLTVADAIRLTLTESDNTAARALDHFSGTDPIRSVYDALDIPVDLDLTETVVTPKNYSSVFRCLYLSCFLNYDSSQHILDLLTQTIFKDGLPAGLPASVPIAHKIGVYDSPDTNQRVRLDCGIVYVPKRPYIMCVMGQTVKGQEQLVASATQQISTMVYQYVSSVDGQ